MYRDEDKNKYIPSYTFKELYELSEDEDQVVNLYKLKKENDRGIIINNTEGTVNNYILNKSL